MKRLPLAVYEARLKQRIALRVVLSDGCWLWTGSMFRNGYGRLKIRIAQGWRDELAHRVLYQLYRGPISSGLEIDHLCRVSRCVNPEHLEAVPHKVNSRRALGVWLSGRTHCKRGHPYTPENLVHYEGRNRCRLCVNERKHRKYWEEKWKD